MKVVARSYMWWSGMDSDLEKLARSCTACQSVNSAPKCCSFASLAMAGSALATHPHRLPEPFQRKNILLLIDAHSKSKIPNPCISRVLDVKRIWKWCSRKLKVSRCFKKKETFAQSVNTEQGAPGTTVLVYPRSVLHREQLWLKEL